MKTQKSSIGYLLKSTQEIFLTQRIYVNRCPRKVLDFMLGFISALCFDNAYTLLLHGDFTFILFLTLTFRGGYDDIIRVACP